MCARDKRRQRIVYAVEKDRSCFGYEVENSQIYCQLVDSHAIGRLVTNNPFTLLKKINQHLQVNDHPYTLVDKKSEILLFVQRTSHILTSSSKGRFKKMPNVYFINVWHDMQNIFDINNVL